MQVYVVSLEHSTDRQKSIRYQCDRLDIKPIFIDAVDGKKLSESEISQYCNQKKAKKLFGRELLSGEIGCALSHKKIYQKIIDENIPYAIILEDDAVIKESFNEAVRLTLNSNINWDLVLLGHYKNNIKGLRTPLSLWDKHSLDSCFTLNRLADFGFGTHGYIITNKCANKLLTEITKISRPIDHYTSDSYLLNVYALYPTVVDVMNNFKTLIDDKNARQKNNDRWSVILLKKIGVINIAVSFKSFLKTVKPIKKYK